MNITLKNNIIFNLLNNPVFNFIKQYIKSMRLYFAFITGIAGWIGMAYYEYLIKTGLGQNNAVPGLDKKIVILILLFLSYGINQIINDFLGLKEDRINAPARPMVTGQLNPNIALIVSFLLIIFTGIITWFYLSPFAVIPLIIGVMLNIIYEYAKGFGVLANIIFGLMITMCTLFGFLACDVLSLPLFTSNSLSLLILIWLLNALMTYYTYFKDYYGDKEVNKKTIVVRFGLNKAKIIGILLSFLPIAIFILLFLTGLITAEINTIFIILGILTFGMQIYNGYLFFRFPKGEKAYSSLVVNIKACSCGQASLIALFNKETAIILFLFAYIFVGFIFHFHKNFKS